MANEQKKRELLALEEKVKDSDHSLAELREVCSGFFPAVSKFIRLYLTRNLHMQQVQVMESSKARLDADAVKLEHDLDERIERNAKANEDMCAAPRPAPPRPGAYTFILALLKILKILKILFVLRIGAQLETERLNCSSSQCLSYGADSPPARGVRDAS